MTPLAEMALALALEANQVEASRIDAPEHTPVSAIVEAMRAELAPKFQAIWDADNPREYLRMGRRVGKSHYLIRKQAAKAAMGSPESINPFILPTYKSATMAIWPLAKRIVLRHFPDARTDETMKIITLPTGARLVYGGCETIADVGRWYSMAFEIAIVDERGNFPDAVLTELDDEALEPALMDYGGAFAGSGNPGRVLRGRWLQQSKDGLRDDPTPLYTGDARDNPFLGQPAADYFEAVKKRHGWTDQSATFRRQYLGEWVEDAGALVFPLRAANMVPCLPERSAAGGVLPKDAWRYVIAVDVGYVDSTAITVHAVHPLDTRRYILRSEKHAQWITGQLGERLRVLKSEFPKAPIVLDTGGMGKIHAEELSRRFGIYVEAAEKREKESAIRTMRDSFMAEPQPHLYVVVDGKSNDPLLEQCSVLGWDEDKRLPEDGQADDVIHAALYGDRRTLHYTRDAVAPVDDSLEARQQRDYDALRLAAQRRVMGGTKNGREVWDR